MLAEVLAGGADDRRARAGSRGRRAHASTIPEPKYGLAVVGEVHPGPVLTNAGLRAGDALVLTKALGVGIATTAIKAGTAPPELADAAVASMTAPNAAAAARRPCDAGATGCTDVTGFGLLGHLPKMAAASGVDAEIDVDAVPFLAGVRELAAGRHRARRLPAQPRLGGRRTSTRRVRTSWTCCCSPTPRPPAACCSARRPDRPPRPSLRCRAGPPGRA